MTDEAEERAAYTREQYLNNLERSYKALPRSSPEYIRLRRQAFEVSAVQAQYAARSPFFAWLPALIRLHRWIFELGYR